MYQSSLDLGTFGDLVAEADEHVFELAPDARDRMQVAAPVVAPAEREVEPVADERRARGVGAEHGAARRRARLRARPRAPRRALPTAARSAPSTVLIASRISLSGDDLPRSVALGVGELGRASRAASICGRPSRDELPRARDEIGGGGHAIGPALAGGFEQQHGAGHRDVQRLARRASGS